MKSQELDTRHYHQALALWNDAPAISGTTKSNQWKQSFSRALEIYLTKQTPSRLFGAFEGEELKSILSMDKIYGWPYYAVGFLATRPSQYFNPVKNGQSVCYALMEETGEKNGWYRYYTHQAARKWKDWRGTFDPDRRYEVTIEEYIPTNGIPTNEAFWSLMNYQVWSVPTTVKSITLKEQFRPSGQ